MMRETLQALPPRDTLAWRWLLRAATLLPWFLAVAVLQWPFRDVPFWGDSLGYMIRNTHWMLEHGSLFHPPDHDPAHPPLGFLTLGTAWALFGRSLLVSHAVQWFWTAVLLAGVARLVRTAARRSRVFPYVAAAFVIAHPVFFSSAMQLTPDVAMTGLYAWMVAFFYERNRRGYMALLCLLLFSKANAWPLVAVFGAAEFLVLPGVALWRVRHQPRKRRAVARWWVTWTNASLLGGAPLLVWLLVHRWHQGFWFTSPIFETSFDANFDPGFLARTFGEQTRLLLWHREGNRELAAMGAAFGVAAGALLVWRGRSHGESYRRLCSGRDHGPCLRPPAALLASFAMQAAVLVVLYTAKDIRLLRFFLPVMLMLIVAVVVAMAFAVQVAQAVAAREPVRGRLLHLTMRIAAAAGIVLTLGHLAIRWNPARADAIPLLPGFVRDNLRNECVLGYEHNAQILPVLEINRWALNDIAWMWNHEGGNGVIVAMYPFDKALEFPEAGFVATPVPSTNFFEFDKFSAGPWDYYVHSPLNFMWDGLSDAQLRRLGARGPVKTYSAPNVSWDYSVTLYERSLPARLDDERRAADDADDSETKPDGE
ncbi:MAG: hypothetical protein PWP23_1971 [Candidatus Sumerlaeota bacterium]|nr:hypothetical protein [Candidatus Sumerlaeota bacterium]